MRCLACTPQNKLGMRPNYTGPAHDVGWGIAATQRRFYSVAAFFPYLVISQEIISRDRDCLIWKPIPSRGESFLFQIMFRTSIITS